MKHLAIKPKHEFRWLRRCYQNNHHDRWWKELRKRCLRMAKRSDRQRVNKEIDIDMSEDP